MSDYADKMVGGEGWAVAHLHGFGDVDLGPGPLALAGRGRGSLPFAAFLTLLLCGSWERPVREQRFKITNIYFTS